MDPCVTREDEGGMDSAGVSKSGLIQAAGPAVSVAAPKPTFITAGSSGAVQVKVPDSSPQTISFEMPPVNVHMKFADGPGEYRLDVVDGQGSPLRVLFDRKIGIDKEAWASWDGFDSQGRFRTSGLYYAVLSKDGRALRKIVLAWTGQKQ